MVSCAAKSDFIDLYYGGSLDSDVFLSLDNEHGSYLYNESIDDYEFKEFGKFRWQRDTCFLYPALLITEGSVFNCREYSEDESYYAYKTDSGYTFIPVEYRVFVNDGVYLSDQSLKYYFNSNDEVFSVYEQNPLLKQELIKTRKCR